MEICRIPAETKRFAMHYDFTTIYDRHNMDALAVDGVGTSTGFSPDAPKEGFSFLPMWVADMNFATVPTIAQAIAKRIEHPLFGYFRPSQAYFDAIINWQRTQNGVEGLLPEHIGYENGVLARRQGPRSEPDLRRLYQQPGKQRLSHHPQRAQKGRRRCLAHGLCRHGRKDRAA